MVLNPDTDTSRQGYVATHSWSVGGNGPPRVLIPPPNLDFSQDQGSMTIRYSAALDYDSCHFGSLPLPQLLASNGIVSLSHHMLDWTYARRREAQKILPFLYVGPLSTANDGNFVRDRGFTFLVAVRAAASGPARVMDASKIADKYGIQSYNLTVGSPSDLIRKVPAAIKAINDHLESTIEKGTVHGQVSFQRCAIQAKVLIFCETGNERAPALVAAYLMAVLNLDAITAIQTVQSQRFSMCLGESLTNALTTFETVLKAQRDVSRANQSTSGNREGPQFTMLAKVKRNLDSVYDEDDEKGQGRDWDEQGQHFRRVGEAPFQDDIE
jgi:serine/threonine/tyrosine-interacting protein